MTTWLTPQTSSQTLNTNCCKQLTFSDSGISTVNSSADRNIQTQNCDTFEVFHDTQTDILPDRIQTDRSKLHVSNCQSEVGHTPHTLREVGNRDFSGNYESAGHGNQQYAQNNTLFAENSTKGQYSEQENLLFRQKFQHGQQHTHNSQYPDWSHDRRQPHCKQQHMANYAENTDTYKHENSQFRPVFQDITNANEVKEQKSNFVRNDSPRWSTYTTYSPVDMDLTNKTEFSVSSPTVNYHHTQFTPNSQSQQNLYPRQTSKSLKRERLPDKFDGKTAQWSDYIAQFRTIANYNGWDEEEKAMNLVMSLTGQAREIITSLPPFVIQNFDLLQEILQRRFDPAEMVSAHRTEFQNRKRKPHESAADFAYELKRLVAKAHPEYDIQTREDRALDQFILGLSDLEMRKHIQFSHPKTLDQAISLAVEYDAVVGQSGQAKKPKEKPETGVFHVAEKSNSLVEVMEKFTEQTAKLVHHMEETAKEHSNGIRNAIRSVKQFTKEKENVDSSKNKGNDWKRNKECYYCHDLGHFKYQCPKLLAKQVNNSHSEVQSN